MRKDRLRQQKSLPKTAWQEMASLTKLRTFQTQGPLRDSSEGQMWVLDSSRENFSH